MKNRRPKRSAAEPASLYACRVLEHTASPVALSSAVRSRYPMPASPAWVSSHFLPKALTSPIPILTMGVTTDPCSGLCSPNLPTSLLSPHLLLLHSIATTVSQGCGHCLTCCLFPSWWTHRCTAHYIRWPRWSSTTRVSSVPTRRRRRRRDSQVQDAFPPCKREGYLRGPLLQLWAWPPTIALSFHSHAVGGSWCLASSDG